VGRTYLSRFPDGDRWRWTIYGSSAGGLELSLDEAKARFKAAFEAAAVRRIDDTTTTG
jgi:hypothetical protein